MQKLFESKRNQAADGLPNTVDAKIILDSAPYILYQEFELDDNFRTYLEGEMISENHLRTGIKKTPLQKCYKMISGSQSRTITFNKAFKQFSFLETSLAFDRSDRHMSIYVSCNTEVAVTHIKSIKLQNPSNTYSEFNTVKFDLEDEEDRHTLHHAFTAWVTEGTSIVPQSDYTHNQTYHKLPKRRDYFTDSDEGVYIDIRRSECFTGEFERVNRDLTITIDLKAVAAKKMRLCVTGYYQREYMYMLGKEGLIMNYKEYGVNKQKTVKQ